MNYVTVFIYRVCEWIMRLAYVNLLWISFSVLGLVALGTFPSTIAMFTVVRQWIKGEIDIKIFPAFWNSYKNDWVKANIIGAILVSVGLVIYIESKIIFSSTEPLVQFSKYPFLLLVGVFLFLVLYILPTYVHYQITIVQLFKNSLLLFLVNPFYNIVMALGLVLLYSIFRIIPPLAFFFAGSASAYVIMWACYQAFNHVDKKKEQQQTKKEEEHSD
ncbi:YesL family protein [Bacillus sp. AK128]